MAYWVKIYYDKSEYIVNFEHVTAFCYERNGRVTFWLPDGAIPIVVNPQNSLEDYQKVLDYVEYVTGLGLEKAYWVKIHYERNEYIINLKNVSSFRHEHNNSRITFWLPDSTLPIIINPVSNPESYQKVLEYIQKATGYILNVKD